MRRLTRGRGVQAELDSLVVPDSVSSRTVCILVQRGDSMHLGVETSEQLSHVVGVVVPLHPTRKIGVAAFEHASDWAGVVNVDPAWVRSDLVNTCSGRWKPGNIKQTVGDTRHTEITIVGHHEAM